MTKQLLLIRHAQAESENNVQKDFDRELNTTGYADASRMGKCLKGKVPPLGAVFASPAHRTTTTAQLITEQLGFDFDKIVFHPDLYETSVRKLVQVINSCSDKFETVMIIGHNPHLTYLAEFLTHEEIGTIPTCGVVAIQFGDLPWAAVAGSTGQLAWLEYPEKVSNNHI